MLAIAAAEAAYQAIVRRTVAAEFNECVIVLHHKVVVHSGRLQVSQAQPIYVFDESQTVLHYARSLNRLCQAICNFVHLLYYQNKFCTMVQSQCVHCEFMRASSWVQATCMMLQTKG